MFFSNFNIATAELLKNARTSSYSDTWARMSFKATESPRNSSEAYEDIGTGRHVKIDETTQTVKTDSEEKLTERKLSRLPSAVYFEAYNPKKPTSVSYPKLFRFATKFELFMVIIGILVAALVSLLLPFGLILYGEFTTLLVDREIRDLTSTPTHLLKLFGGGRILTNASPEEASKATIEDSQAFLIGSIVASITQLILSQLSIDIINRMAQRQITRIRKLFLESVLRQDMKWYDMNTDENFAVKMVEDLEKLREGIGEKLAIFTTLLMSFVSTIAFAFFYGWKLTLVILSCAPFIVLSTALVARMQSSLTEKELKAYSKAGTVAEEVLGSIRTVVAYGGEQKELERYERRLIPAEESGKKKGIYSGIGAGSVWLVIYSCYALAFWYGIDLILDDRNDIDKEYTPAVLMIVLFGVLAGAENLGLSAPHLEAFATASGSALSIFNVIDRIPDIDSMSESGKKPKKIHGKIKFENVKFRYPTRNDIQVLNGLNLEIDAGRTVALVGPSGCGKSTCLQLLQQLYNPLSGALTVDNIRIQDWNVKHLRSFIGVVGQEPVLFSTTIRENIRYGKPEASDEDIEKAARMANCHKFIMKLPKGYNTMIGERGASLSGGQKQRIAIARALVKNPKILLLDEATSALDPTSEKRVQLALEKASEGRTTVVVSHRMSTITKSDKIVYIDKGVVVEQGTHAELMKKQGAYFDLVLASQDSDQRAQRRRSSRMRRKSSLLILDDSSSEDEIDTDDETGSKKELKVERMQKFSSLGLIKMNSHEWPELTIGAIASMIVGASFPVFAILFGDIYGFLVLPDIAEIRSSVQYYSFLFLGLGFITGIATFIQTYMFNCAGVKLTSRLRSQSFETMMKQEMAWYDDARNAVGALCARLAGDCASVQGATGSRIGSMVQAASVIIIGIVISFYYNWKMTLVASAGVPLVLMSVVAESKYVESSSRKEKFAMESATKMAVEAISNIRTVASLGQEPHVLERYMKEIEKVYHYAMEKIRFRGLVFGLGQTVPVMGYGISLWYGGTLVANREMMFQDVIKIGEALIFGSWMLGQALAYAPNVNNAITAATRIQALVSRKPAQRNPVASPVSENQNSTGNIIYKDVEFRYPTRRSVRVLDGLNLEIKEGTTVALVGPSGCGKSTCMQLLLRYYDPDAGEVDLDGARTVDYPLSRIREKFGLVSQEPILFDRTIAENIAYGDNNRRIPMAEIIEAAKSANIHDFIVKLPKGYNTGLGYKGASLSGGQKQRIAIARALVRNPKILLLDEATSALDTQSEKLVQAALDRARTGRTCVMIAHRLTTVQNADLIYVLEDGEVVEKGTHEQLLRLGQKYARLSKLQRVN